MIKQKKSLNNSNIRLLFLILGLLFLLAACGPNKEDPAENTPAPTTSGTELEGGGYPPPGDTAGYPPIGETAEAGDSDSAYPPPLATDKPPFQLDLPLTAGHTTVSGQAPEALPLAIVDISFGGTILGTGSSDEDGRFSITVTPLPAGHRIGVTITEFESGITFEQIAEQYFPYRGEGFINVPNVGIFYDSSLTKP